MRIAEILADSPLSQFEAELLLAEVLAKPKEWIFLNPDVEVSKKDLASFHDLEGKRLSGISIAALLGKKEFFGLELLVDENVLIPRPETEMLVEEIISLAPQNLLDIGTGSGAIAIAVKKNLPDCKVTAIDISPAALNIAKKNSERLDTEVEFIESDLLTAMPEKKFEIIAANLPYIPFDSTEVEAGVKKFEPNLALFSGTDGLDLVRKLLNQIAELPQKPNFILLEFGGEDQAETLEDLTKKLFPDSEIEIKKDLAGIPRMLKLKP